MRVIVGELHDLRTQIDQRLHLASVAARDEWDNLQSRIPRIDDLGSGAILLSRFDLEEMKSKLFRFGQILLRLGGP